MARLIVKSPYLKGGGRGGYVRYIGTRDGVELLPSGYMEYMAGRPRSHGLFGDEEDIDLEKAIAEVNEYPGNIWTHIISLKREDAARLGFDHARQWRNILLAHRNDIAAAMHIPPKDFRWYAAFHNEGEHPHIHMMVWSDDPKRGFLTRRGIELMRSKLTNAIFRDELLNLYQRKDVSYKDLTYAAQDAMKKLIDEMRSGLCDSPDVALRMSELAGRLESVKGKKQYGYLKKPLKEKVDAIVDELAKVPEVAQCYEVWNKLRDELESYYHEKTQERLPLSQQKEFRSIKNIVIREAERVRLGGHTFEDDPVVSRLTASAAQGNEQAQVFLDRWDSIGKPSVMLSVTRLLHHLSRVFQDNVQSRDTASMIQNIDRKLRQRIREKKMAMGHKPDDHEEYQGPTMSV